MKKMSVATMNRYADTLALFPSYKMLSDEAISEIEKAFDSDEIVTLAIDCLTLDHEVALAYWTKAVEKASDTLETLKANSVDVEQIEKAEGKLAKIVSSRPVLNTESYFVCGYILQNFFGVLPSCVVPSDMWDRAFTLRSLLYSPVDYGKNGKQAEVRDRLDLYELNGQTKTTWSQFSAHKSGQKDITDKWEGIHIEKKTGVGDWYTSKQAKTLESIRRELERKTNDRIRWDYEKQIVKPASKTKPQRIITLSIHWEKTWPEFFRILEDFNGDIGTWFKPVKVTENGYLIQLQEIQTSEKKIEYLMKFNDR